MCARARWLLATQTSYLYQADISSGSVNNVPYLRDLYLAGITGTISIRLPNIRLLVENRCGTHCGVRSATRRRASLSLTPSFRRKGRKMPANFCFGPDARPRPRNYFSLPASHCLQVRYIPTPNHTRERGDSNEFVPRENFRNIISSLAMRALSTPRALSAVARHNNGSWFEISPRDLSHTLLLLSPVFLWDTIRSGLGGKE